MLFFSCLMRYGGGYLQQSCMSVRINNSGTRLVALRRRLPPVLYDLSNTYPLCDLDHDGYYNSCTMKSCCFAGPNDEVSGAQFYYCLQISSLFLKALTNGFLLHPHLCFSFYVGSRCILGKMNCII